MPNCQPNLLLYLNIDPALALKRIKQRNALDRIEKETISFFQRANQMFLELAKYDKSCIIVDAALSIHKVEKFIIDAIEKFTYRFIN